MLSSYEPIEQTRATFDIGLQVGRRAEALFDCEPIADDLIFPVCSPAFAKKLNTRITPAELASLPLLHIDYDDKDWVDWRRFLANYRIRGKAPPEQLAFSSYQVCLDVAERGEGIALGWARSVNQRIAEGKLVRCTNLSLYEPEGISVYLRKHTEPHPIAAKVIEAVRASIEPLGNDTTAYNV